LHIFELTYLSKNGENGILIFLFHERDTTKNSNICRG